MPTWIPPVTQMPSALNRFIATAVVLAVASAGAGSAFAHETRTYAVGYLYLANYAEDGDCPNGMNPSSTQVWINGMRALDLPEDKIKDYFDSGSSIKSGKQREIQREYIINRGRIGGSPVNIYANPLARPYLREQPRINTTVSRYAYGFNLDGQGADSPSGFEDPESHERGVDNQFFRVMSCMQSYRAKPPLRPAVGALIPGSTQTWITARQSMPAWLMTVSGEDLGRDGEVTVTIERSLDSMDIDGQAEPMAYDTFRIDPSSPPNRFKAKLVAGVITAEPVASFYMKGDQYALPEYRLRQVHLRIAMKADGTLNALLGGYQPWMDIYMAQAGPGKAYENQNSIDTATYYLALKQHADAHPDPSTGQNTEISATYRIEAVPAYIVPPATPALTKR